MSSLNCPLLGVRN